MHGYIRIWDKNGGTKFTKYGRVSRKQSIIYSTIRSRLWWWAKIREELHAAGLAKSRVEIKGKCRCNYFLIGYGPIQEVVNSGSMGALAKSMIYETTINPVKHPVIPSRMDGASLCPERATIHATTRVNGIARLCVVRPQLRIFDGKKNRTMQLSPYLSPPLYWFPP
jgi:hypothetical protein